MPTTSSSFAEMQLWLVDVGTDMGSDRTVTRRVITCLDEVDARAFSDVLRAEFPNLRFMPYEYHRRQAARADDTRVRPEPQYGPVGKVLQLSEHMDGHRGIERLLAFSFPSGWTPDWLPYADIEALDAQRRGLPTSAAELERRRRHWDGFWGIANLPEQQFHVTYHHSEGTVCTSEMMWGRYLRSDAESQAFFRRAVRLLWPVTSPMATMPGPHGTDQPHNSHIFIGLHARQVIRSHPGWTVDDAWLPTDDDTPWSELEQRLRRERRANKVR